MDTDNTGRNRASNFTRWGKWVLIGVLVAAVIITLLLICCCLVFRRHKKSKARKRAKDSEAGAFNNHNHNHDHRSEKIHQPMVNNGHPNHQYNSPAAVVPTHAPPTRMEPVYNNNNNNNNNHPQALAHDYTTVDQGYNNHSNHNTRNMYNDTNGYQSQTMTQGENYQMDNQRMSHGDNQRMNHGDNQRMSHGNENRNESRNGNMNMSGNDGFAPTAALYDNLPAQASKHPARY